jgi:hypothetical protein
MITVGWVKCGHGPSWCRLETVDLTSVRTTGVYVIWHAGHPARVVRVGQGDITARLTAHRADPEILKYRELGTLFVTWAAVPAHQLDGVERYLANAWPPLIGDVFPYVAPLPVNSPFAA